MGLEEYRGVYVFAQQVDNELSGIAFELLGKAKDLAKDLDTDVTAVLVGSDVKGLVDDLAKYGADKVIVVDDPELKEYRTEPYTHALASVINEYKPEIMLVGATAIGRDLGPRVSARVQTGLTADCTVLEIGDFPLRAIPGKEQKHNQLLMTRPAFGGNTIATIACPDNRPQMATVRPGVMQKIDPIEGAKAEVIEYNPGFTPDNKYVEIVDIVKSVTDTVDIMDAKILVSGGRGVGEEGFGMLRELADVLGGEVSCSRAVVEYMKENGGGVILNTSSMVSIYGQPSGCGYPASKFAVNGLTKSLARELGRDNIRVNAVAPGVTLTDMMKNVPDSVIEPIIKEIPLGRIGTPEDIANAFLFLASDMASYITGVILSVDGAARS